MYFASLNKWDKTRPYRLIKIRYDRCDAHDITTGAMYYGVSLNLFERIIPCCVPVVGV